MKRRIKIISINNLKFRIQMFFSEFKFFFYRLQRRNLKVFRYFDQRKIGSIPRILLSSIFVVLFFYLTPIFLDYRDKNFFETKEFKNDSKAVLAYTLNKKNSNLEGDDKFLDEKDLLFDIFSLNDLETDTVRLNASTIKQLFDDTNYRLKDVRETKLVKPYIF